MTTAEKYVLAAYLAVLFTVLAYVVIFSTKLARLERELGELVELVRTRREEEVLESREEAHVG